MAVAPESARHPTDHCPTGGSTVEGKCVGPKSRPSSRKGHLMFTSRLLAGLLLLGTVAAPTASAAYRVRYRPAPQAPWQVYATTPSLATAQGNVAQLRAKGYPAQYAFVQPGVPATLPAAGSSAVAYHYHQFHHAGYQTHHYR